MKKYFPFLFLFILFSCKPAVQKAPEAESANETTLDHKLLEHKMLAVLFVQQSAEYRVLTYQAFQLGEMRLREIRKQRPAQKLAVVVDIDETVLDNSPYAAWQLLNDQPYTSGSWKIWSDMAAADTVPGASRFLHVADSLGFAVFYISNRREAEQQATMENLRKFNLPTVNVNRVLLRTTISSKKPRREMVGEQGYEIALLAGDNLADFLEDFEKRSISERFAKVDSLRSAFGSHFIMLPNPVYGDWESAMYDYSYALTPAQQDSARRSLLRGFGK